MDIQLDQLYNEIMVEIQHQAYHSAIEQAAGMVALAKLVEHQKYVLLGKYLMGICYFHLQEYQVSMEKYLELMNTVLSFENDLEELELKPYFLDQVRYGMAVNMYNLGDLDGASIVLGHLLEEGKEISTIFDSAILLGVIYIAMYDLTKNISYLVKTLEIYLTLLEEAGLPRPKKAMLHNNLAILFTYQGEYQKAQEMLNDAFVQATTQGETVSIFNEMARIHLEMHNYDKVRKNLEKAKEYLSECSSPTEEGQHYLLQGRLRCAEENYTEAQRLMEKAFFLAKRCNNRFEQVRACRELAVLYEKMGHSRDSEFFLEYKDLKDSVNPVKEVIKWQETWQMITQAHGSLIQTQTRKAK